MIRRPPRSTQSRSSAASDVYKRQMYGSTRALLPHATAPALRLTKLRRLYRPLTLRYLQSTLHMTLDRLCQLPCRFPVLHKSYKYKTGKRISSLHPSGQVQYLLPAFPDKCPIPNRRQLRITATIIINTPVTHTVTSQTRSSSTRATRARQNSFIANSPRYQPRSGQ